MPVDRYLGCHHVIGEQLSPITGKKVRTMTYDNEHFLRECVQAYEQLTNTKASRRVTTPFIPDEEHGPIPSDQAITAAAQTLLQHAQADSTTFELWDQALNALNTTINQNCL